MTCSDFPLQRTTITEEEWTAVLRLSAMWDFFDVHRLAIEELSKVVMSPVTKILLARQFTIQKWLFAGYEELAKRTEPISVGEAEQLGWETAILIFQIREESLAKFQTIRIEVIRVDNVEGGEGQGTVYSETLCNTGDPFDRMDCNCAEEIQRVFAKEFRVDEVVAVPE
jgi:hypothetical protein